MYSLMVNKERDVLLPADYHKNAQPYEAVYAKMSEDFNEVLHKYSKDASIQEFKISLLHYINSLVDLYDEI